jgi:hypothetical protein
MTVHTIRVTVNTNEMQVLVDGGWVRGGQGF